MPSMWGSEDEGDERASGSHTSGETTWLEDLSILGPDGKTYAWAQRWALWKGPNARIIAIPKLALAQVPLFRLVHVRSYPDAFKDCCLSGPGLDFHPFQVIGATFPFYRTGRPELREMVLTLENGSVELSRIIQIGSALLT